MPSLSQWPKRDDLYRYLDSILSASPDPVALIALLIINLDNFRDFCELFEYRDIEEFLAQVGQIIMNSCPDYSYMAWLGSDEFAVVLPKATKEDVERTAAAICQNLAEPMAFHERQVHITGSLGYALLPDDAKDRYEIIKNATMAMNWVKKQGKNGYARFEAAMGQQVNRKLKLINDFGTALEQGQFRLQYQPQVSVASRSIVGAEALLRWQHPEFNLIPPLEFIPLAEESGYIHHIGEWVLYQAASDFSAWLQKGIILERLAVNVSIVQLQKPDFAKRSLHILEETHLDPAYLELEITESQSMDLPKVRPQIEQLRNHGVRFAIDDFGTGFASLNHLRYMGFDTIKIDKAYIHNILTNSRDQVIVNSILNMAKMLRLGIIAEGVETDDQWQYILQAGIKEVQGYYCSPPVDQPVFEELVRKEFCF